MALHAEEGAPVVSVSVEHGGPLGLARLQDGRLQPQRLFRTDATV